MFGPSLLTLGVVSAVSFAAAVRAALVADAFWTSRKFEPPC